MIEIKSNEVKAKFSEVIRRVAAGEHYLVTRHGEVVAEIIPYQKPSKRDINQVVSDLLAFKKVAPPENMTIKKMIEAGRR